MIDSTATASRRTTRHDEVTSTSQTNRGVQTPLEIYLREINETPLLNAQDERDLAKSIALGDAQARDHMVRANLRLVVNIARGYTGKGLTLQDLIKQSIKRALINSAKTIRIPAYMVELLSKWRRANARLKEELGRTPTAEEIARILGLPKKKLPIIKKAIHVYTSPPQTDQADSGWSLGEIVMDDRVRNPEEALLETDALRTALELLAELDERESTVLKMRFGLENLETHTLKEIGEELGLTRERVRQIETEALAKLAQGLEDPRDRLLSNFRR
jgi:RNA polymerase primary sigma factor